VCASSVDVALSDADVKLLITLVPKFLCMDAFNRDRLGHTLSNPLPFANVCHLH